MVWPGALYLTFRFATLRQNEDYLQHLLFTVEGEEPIAMFMHIFGHKINVLFLSLSLSFARSFVSISFGDVREDVSMCNFPICL